jgi:hypothetical protein
LVDVVCFRVDLCGVDCFFAGVVCFAAGFFFAAVVDDDVDECFAAVLCFVVFGVAASATDVTANAAINATSRNLTDLRIMNPPRTR